MSERLILALKNSDRAPAELPRSGVLVIGSDPKRAGFTVTGVGIADAHCAIGRNKGGGFALKDLGAAIGTLLNGKRVESAKLEAGDEITVGSITLCILDPEAPVPVTPSAAVRPRAELPAEDARSLAVSAAAARASENSTLPNAAPNASNPPAPAPRPEWEATAPRAASMPQITGYKLERQLGRGGMGSVYLAVQTSLDRKVAIKVLSKKFEADAAFVKRFQAEARAAAALNHPNVVTVYDVGEDRGTHYLSMEYMEKDNLEARIEKGGRLPIDEVLGILRDAASGLVYAEARGIVHRDLKPANLMQNHVGQTKIADLGLATHVESEELETADKKVFGTPHFMSPEQARGERVGSSSDLYSLGATAYRLLTGHTPFEGETAREIVRKLLKEDPRPMREFAPDLPVAVVAMVERLMRKDASQRFGSASELVREIEKLRAPAAPAARVVTVPHKSGVGGKLAVAALLGLAVGGAGYWYWKVQGSAVTPDPLAELGYGTKPPAPRDSASGTTGAGGNPTPPTADGTGETTGSAANTSAGNSGSPREKDDRDLQIFEKDAKLALLELLQKQMAKTEMRTELRALAGRFAGTSAATEALEKADAITSEEVASLSAASAKTGQIELQISRLRAVAGLDKEPPEPGTAILAMRAVELGNDLIKDRDYIATRKLLEQSVMSHAVSYAESMMAASARALDAGDYAGAKKKLEDLQLVFVLPDFPTDDTPAGTGELRETGRRARERLANLEGMRSSIKAKAEREDAVQLAAGLGGAAGLESELRAFDFRPAKARAQALAAKVTSGASKLFAQGLAEDCERAQAMIDTLVREFSTGGWRRKSFNDPRDKRAPARNAIGASAQGILIDEGGKSETVPWWVFSSNTEELSRLLYERLTREYTAAEYNGIAALLRFAAVNESLAISAKMFDLSKKANFTETNAKAVQEAFVVARQWSQKAGADDKRLEREIEALNLFASVLRQTTESQWSTAVAGTERLLKEFGDTLLVQLMSDGTSADEAAPAANEQSSAGDTPKKPG